MKKLLILFFLLTSCFSGFAQDYLSIANNCYKQGDYECARDNYKLVPNNETAMLLRSKAVLCLSYLSDAEDSFQKGNYQNAKENYEAILKINPDDANAISQINACDENMKPKAAANDSSYAVSTQSAVQEENTAQDVPVSASTTQEVIPREKIQENEADSCVNVEDYDNALKKYKELLEVTTGTDNQRIQLNIFKLVNSYKPLLDDAKKAFDERNYDVALAKYQELYAMNPNDSIAKNQIEKCQEHIKQEQAQNASKPTLRKATTAELTDIWNNKYGVLPARRQNLINAGIDPYDAQSRINKGEGKPATITNQETKLWVSDNNIYFPASGGTQNVTVTANTGSYNVRLLPSWCSVVKNYNGFVITCTTNLQNSARNDWFEVDAGDKEIRINIFQSANYLATSQDNNTNNYASPNRKSNKTKYKSQTCFNCPTAKYSWGLTIGYISKFIDYGLDNSSIDYSGIDNKMDGITVGLRFEPLFKYGFGLNTGFNYEYYSKSFNYNEYIAGYDDNVSYNYQEHALNIPLHLEYRLNFSKYFNIFAYGGLGLDVVTDSSFSNFTTNALFEYGGGLRIDHVQFNIGRSNLIKNLSGSQNVYYNMNNKYKDWIISISYMFK